MRIKKSILGIATGVFFMLPAFGHGTVPQRIHYQGYLADLAGEPIHCPDAEDNCPSGPVNMEFKMYLVPEGGDSLWAESKVNVSISKGIFHVALGLDTPITHELLAGEFIYLGVNVNATGELLPRQRLVSTAYALRAGYAEHAATSADAQKLGGVEAANFLTQDSIYDWCLSAEAIAQMLDDAKYLSETNAVDFMIDQGFLRGEADPVYASSPAAGITDAQKAEWSVAHGWGDHDAVGYLKDEQDPVFASSPAADVSVTQMDNWDTAHGWGNHAAQGYLLNEQDPSVGELVADQWCRAEGGKVLCDQPAPKDTDTTYTGTDFALSDQSCPDGENMTGVDIFGDIICSAGALDTLGSLQCEVGQVAAWSGSAWSCVEQSSVRPGKPIMARTVEVSTWGTNFETVSLEPLFEGNHLTPSTLTMELKTSYSGHGARAYFVIHYDDGTQYTSSAFQTTYESWSNMLTMSLPIHSGLRGTITRVEVFVGSTINTYDATAYARLTLSGYETPPSGMVPSKPFIARSIEAGTWGTGYEKISIEPLKEGNHLTPTSIRLEMKASYGPHPAEGYYEILFADGTSYSVGTFYISNESWFVASDRDLPIHEGLRGTVTRINLYIRSSINTYDSTAFARLTVSGHETGPGL